MARGAGEPHGAGLRDAGRAARAVDGERHRTLLGKIAAQLHQRAHAAARGRTPRRAEPEPLQDPRNPLAVEVLTGNDDDIPSSEVMKTGEDAPVPEREDRLMTGANHLIPMLGAVNLPAERRTERRDQRIANARSVRP